MLRAHHQLQANPSQDIRRIASSPSFLPSDLANQFRKAGKLMARSGELTELSGLSNWNRAPRSDEGYLNSNKKWKVSSFDSLFAP